MSAELPRHARAEYIVEQDEEDIYVLWRSRRSDSHVGEHDNAMRVYLPSGRRTRARAARVIADALNAAEIPRARRPRKP